MFTFKNIFYSNHTTCVLFFSVGMFIIKNLVEIKYRKFGYNNKIQNKNMVIQKIHNKHLAS